MLGLGIGIGPMVNAIWSPAALMGIGHWAGGYTQAALWQDAAGTFPVLAAGHPVGKLLRAGGTVDASQATALSKPTYARWPKTGRRNLGHGFQAMTNEDYWPQSVLGGIARTKVGSGLEGGFPYLDIHLSGTATSTSIALYQTVKSAMPVVAGASYSHQATVKFLSGVPTGGTFLRTTLTEGTGMGAGYIRGAVGDAVSTSTYGVSAITYTAIGGDSNYIYAGFELRTAVGTVLDHVIRVKALQWEAGSLQTALQNNYGPNDITEPGFPDLWHLYNDGGDSLNVVLPAGTYGLASIDINRAITVTTVTSDGTTAINTLRHERQLDFVIRAEAFTSAEEAALRSYWMGIYT